MKETTQFNASLTFDEINYINYEFQAVVNEKINTIEAIVVSARSNPEGALERANEAIDVTRSLRALLKAWEIFVQMDADEGRKKSALKHIKKVLDTCNSSMIRFDVFENN